MGIHQNEPRAGGSNRFAPLARYGQPALAALVAALFLPAGLQSVIDGGPSTAWSLALTITLVGLHLSLATARRWPSESFALGALACLVLLVAPDVDAVTDFVAARDYAPIQLPSTLCFFALLYAVSARTQHPHPALALGVGVVGSCLTLLRVGGASGSPLASWAWWLLVGTTAFGGTVAAWALGRYRVTRTAWTAQLADKAAADERRRIAREMHDVVAHSLAVMVSHAEAGQVVTPRAPERAPEFFMTIADTGREALTEMRGLLGVLRDGDAAAEPQPVLEDLPALVERVRAAGLDVDFSMDNTVRPTPTVGLTIYRVVQEALTNVSRHAVRDESGRRTTVLVRVDADTHGVEARIEDTGATALGTASDPPNGTVTPGRGLTGMRERVDAVGGSLEAGPTDAGWVVQVRVPS